MSGYYSADNLKRALEVLPGVASVGEIEVRDGIIRRITIRTRSVGNLITLQLDAADAPALFDFYFQELSEMTRRLFIPYPLFHTPPSSDEELAQRIVDWQKEDDWSALKMVKGNEIVGFGLLKRFRTPQVTSGIVIRDDFLRKGLGYILQTIIVGQARLLNLKKFHAKVISDNFASVRLHEKCGFKKTGTVTWDGYEDLRDFLDKSNYEGKSRADDRYIIEMVIELNHLETD